MRSFRLLVALLLAAACARAQPAPLVTQAGPPLYAGPAAAPLELVESWPLETSLDHADLRDAKDVWLELINGAKRSLDFAEFYASDDPKAESALTRVVAALQAAASRGVKVRWLGEEKFYKTYPALMDRFAKLPGFEVRRLDARSSMGGILHAKYFLVDGEQGYLGSQNFDWRSLEHIQELGVRFSVPAAVRALADVFESDWALASGSPPPARPAAYGFPARAGDLGAVTLVASPKGYLPDESLWELPRLVQLIDSAKRTVRVQVLTYKARGRGGELRDLEEALQRAAARGVKVELIAADWGKRKGTIEGLQHLHAPPSLSVKLLSVPQWSHGFVPFARVAHAKYLVVDGERAWVGTSNWERDYFFKSRNVGLVIVGGPLPARLDAFFADNWNGPYVEVVDPARTYEAPNISAE